MAITLQDAQDIMRGYMAPRSHAINVFAQKGELHYTLDNIDPDTLQDTAKQELIEAIMREFVEQSNLHLDALRLANGFVDKGMYAEASVYRGNASDYQTNAAHLQQVAAFIDRHFEG